VSYINLEAHYIEHVRGGVSVGSVAMTLALGNGTTVSLPAPFVRLNSTLAVAPVITPDGDAGARIDFSRWLPLRYGGAGPVCFPMFLTSQALAARVAHAFDADPGTRWTDTPEQIKAWLLTWAAANNVALRG
jgi:hypothetical protein